MTEDSGRVPAAPGSHPSDHAASGVDGASRFDPSRDELPVDLDRESYKGKPRRLPKEEKVALESFIDDIKIRLSGIPDSELYAVVRGCLNVSPTNCWCWTYAFADVVYPFAAEEVERRRDRDASLAEDAKRLSPEGVAARAEGIAQTTPGHPKDQEDGVR